MRVVHAVGRLPSRLDAAGRQNASSPSASMWTPTRLLVGRRPGICDLAPRMTLPPRSFPPPPPLSSPSFPSPPCQRPPPQRPPPPPPLQPSHVAPHLQTRRRSAWRRCRAPSFAAVSVLQGSSLDCRRGQRTRRTRGYEASEATERCSASEVDGKVPLQGPRVPVMAGLAEDGRKESRDAVDRAAASE